MRLCLSTVFVVSLMLAPLRAGEVIDRLIATVNGHAILQSDWNDELRYECFMSGRALRDLTPEDRRAAFERLIDQELLREQAHSSEFKPANAEQIALQVEEAKKQFSQQHPGQSWADALQQAGMSDADVGSHIAAELDSLRLVDARLRPSIQIDSQNIEDYYKKDLLPKLANGQKMTLQEASPTIREILIQEKMNALLNSWLETLRAQANIRILAEPAAVAPRAEH